MKDQYRELHATSAGRQTGGGKCGAVQTGKNNTWGKNPPPIGALCCPSHAVPSQTNNTEHRLSLDGPFQGVGRNLLHRTPKREKGQNFSLPP